MMRLAALACLLAGCLDVPGKPTPQCTTTADCNSAAGEVCEEGTCWGNPPTGSFAAVIVPPNTRTELAPTELPLITIPDHGWLGDLVLEDAVTIAGRVEPFCQAPMTCDGTSISANITITRPPLFAGGSGFRITTQSKAGLARGVDSFTASVPRTHAGEPPYTITIVPDGRGDTPPANGATSPAELAPPLRMTLAAATNVETGSVVLGSAASQVISGVVTDATGHPLPKYRVVALGRWDSVSAPTEVSTVDYTATGQYTITLSDGIVGAIEIVARPYDPNIVAATLHLPSVPAVSSTKNISQPVAAGSKLAVAIPVEGVQGNGEVTPVAGARVVVTGVYEPTFPGGTRAILTSDATTGDDGLAHLTLLDGTAFASTYTMQVIPPASSTLGIVYDEPFALDQTTPVRLPTRIKLTGTVLDAGGSPLGNVSVTATPSTRFRWSLEPAPQQFLAEIPAATTTTPDTGAFIVWVDPFLASVWGHYDLRFEPSSEAAAPSWTQPDIEIPRTATTAAGVSLGTVTLPAPAHIHGRITDAGGSPVEGGTLGVYGIQTNLSLCSQVTYHPDNCVLPADLLGHGTADGDGVVRLTLPRP